MPPKKKTSIPKSNQQSSLCSSVIGKPYLKPPPETLRTIDGRVSNKLYDRNLARKTECRVNLQERFEADCLFVVKDLLSKAECKAIVKNSASYNMQNVQYEGRSNSRMVVFDTEFAQYIWEKISKGLQKVFKDKNIRIEPRGFDVLHGDWNFAGANEAIRLNKYNKDDHFAMHRDAQVCPSGDHRSMLSLVVYLNNDFKGGQTNFYVPTKKHKFNYNDMTLSIEKMFNEMEKLTKKVVVRPEIGKAVLFSQSMLHESTKITTKKCKYILKTDIMVSREPVGFRVHPLEEKDYLKCIDYFRTAQQLELKPKKNKKESASDFYEKCLKIRYLYPTQELRDAIENPPGPSKAKKKRVKKQEKNSSENNAQLQMETKECAIENLLFRLFPEEVWIQIFSYIECEADAKKMVKVFPALLAAKQQSEKKKMIPKVAYNWGANTKFSFVNGDFVANNLTDCARVVALYSVFLLGHDPEAKTYVVNYNQETECYISVELEDLLSSVFYREKLYGACYKVAQQAEEKQPKEDFENSVDRRYMYMVHGRQFTGVDLENMRCMDIDVLHNEPDSDSDALSVGSDLPEPPAQPHGRQLNGSGCNQFEDEEVINHAINTEVFVSHMYNRCEYDEQLILDIELPENTPFVEYKKRHVGGAVVRKVKEPTEMKHLCICEMHHPEHNGIKDKFRELTFNHLVFDFSAHKLTVERKSKLKCCPYDEHQEIFMSRHKNNKDPEATAPELPEKFDWKYTVRIGELSKNATDLSFNHASCQCVFPVFRLNEFISMSSYPYLDHIHVGFAREGERMLAFASYGGIAAM